MACKKNQSGETISVYDGKYWVSDFIQRDFYGSPSKRFYNPSYTIYRKPE
jgi:hypothetical protein